MRRSHCKLHHIQCLQGILSLRVIHMYMYVCVKKKTIFPANSTCQNGRYIQSAQTYIIMRTNDRLPAGKFNIYTTQILCAHPSICATDEYIFLFNNKIWDVSVCARKQTPRLHECAVAPIATRPDRARDRFVSTRHIDNIFFQSYLLLRSCTLAPRAATQIKFNHIFFVVRART